jgi:three-Cys-motif partner protein
MAIKDLHETPFDETTISKLEIFEDYAQAWIPTFVMQGISTICIFDFFAGTGYDKEGVPGSPIRILKKIKEQIGHIFQKKVKVILYLNEFEPGKKDQTKFQLLQKACLEFLEKNKDVNRAIEIKFSNKDFEEIFPDLLPLIKQFPSLVYLDQNGIKFLSEKYFLELEKTKQTDFLYFVSASYFWRFGNSKEFKVHLDIDMSEAKKDPYKFIHRNIIDQLRKKLPATTKLKLYPFSLKKGSNIHGIIFGASHPRAVDKFLSISWKKNTVNGQANFDIEDDSKKNQLDIFESKKLTKIEGFQKMIREKVLAGEIRNNQEAFIFALDHGHIGVHAALELKIMKKEGLINYDGSSPLVTYDNVYKAKKVTVLKVIKK